MTLLQKNIKSYENEILEIKNELKRLPEGYLIQHGSTYYIRVNKTDKGITRNLELIRKLARKAYLQRRLEHLEANLCSTKLFMKYKTKDPSEIVRGLSSAYQTLPFFFFFHPGIHNNLSHKEKTRQTTYRPEELIYYTSSGIQVRSKSERTIADTLYRYQIPFHYEAPIVLDSVVWHPDFTIYRPSDGKLLLWEHFGVMDDEKYRKRAADKIAAYIRNGYYPSGNLICTYEQDLRKPSHLEKIIDSFILSC